MEQYNDDDSRKHERNDLKTFWNRFSFIYYSSICRAFLSQTNILLTLSRVYKKTNILDVGCGPGIGTKLIASEIMNIETNIYAIDISDEMLNLAEKVFTEYDDFNYNINNYWDCRKEAIKGLKLEDDLQEIRRTKIGKIVRFLQGNAESLPFENSQFDAYISNFCFMYNINFDKVLKEAYRVLKPQGVAAFSIIDWEKESKLVFSIFANILKEYDIDLYQEIRTKLLNEKQNSEFLRETMFANGFSKVYIESSTVIFDCFDESDFLIQFLFPFLNKILENIKDDIKVKNILEKVKIEARKQIVCNGQLPILKTKTILATKIK
jgi:ubiquinone/menaquinone biosynthesis C-methylase UbiE